ncbi:sulfurtransferase complex subunit TusB [Methylobacter tundripaludum]|uniref:Sulfur relay protein TusB/DsrH n=1 Tax=Methylobacter tundripaludum (strain ATCC BAA-1195 / DSM 17260 / SV96) TaxID=697282 RepID=G3IST0_METTV|nr:sulfurtransferase complex subunit TusB [Methylobacter tundripaludum]EGW21290.1 sulfur relay protein TusB/DsrH [Methylobacter tundripaludum SV96]
MLHLIFQSPIETALLERIDSGDVVVFLENAALRVLQNSSISDTLTRQLGSNRLCVLSDDIAIRGIASDELVKGIEVIDYAGLVELTVNNPIIQTWT